jgi:hypothetical protein
MAVSRVRFARIGRLRQWWWRRTCVHPLVHRIYGDAIIHRGGNYVCDGCERAFDGVPEGSIGWG